MDRYVSFVEKKIHIVYEPEEGGGKFGVDPIFLNGDNTGTFPQSVDFNECLLCLFSASTIV